MFDPSFPELILIVIIGLFVLGPQRLPKVAAEIGKWVGRARRTASQLRRQLEREIELEELERLRAKMNQPIVSADDAPTTTAPAANESVTATADATSAATPTATEPTQASSAGESSRHENSGHS